MIRLFVLIAQNTFEFSTNQNPVSLLCQINSKVQSPVQLELTSLVEYFPSFLRLGSTTEYNKRPKNVFWSRFQIQCVEGYPTVKTTNHNPLEVTRVKCMEQPEFLTMKLNDL